MIGEYSSEKCQNCGGKLIIKKEIHTFDGIIEDCKCVNCNYTTTNEK